MKLFIKMIIAKPEIGGILIVKRLKKSLHYGKSLWYQCPHFSSRYLRRMSIKAQLIHVTISEEDKEPPLIVILLYSWRIPINF